MAILQWVESLEHIAVNAPSTSMPLARPAARSFRDLVVWRQAHAFVLAVYRYTATFPKQETYGLSLQMRRAAISIAANVAEGFAKRTKPEKARYLNIAEGSLEESRYYVILAQDLGYGDTQALATSLDEVSRLLNAYVRTLLAPSFWLPISRRDIKGEALG